MRHVEQAVDTCRTLLDRLRSRPALLLGMSLGGLLIAIAITGTAGLAINRNVADITERALVHDINLEDEGDDLRAAVLDLRHYHRDVFFLGPNYPNARTNFLTAYHELHKQISDYSEIDHSPGVLTADELKALAETYYATFQPAIELYYEDRNAFDAASERGLATLATLESATQRIDGLGEMVAEASLANLDRANQQARWILLAVLGGLVLVGGGLVWSAFRVGIQLRKLYEDQQESARRLAEVVQAKADFIADASHELRTPLTVLRGNAEAGLAMDNQCVHREILGEIVSESVRMTRLVEDLLFLARSDADSLPLVIEPIAAEPFAVDLAERARMLIRQYGHELKIALAGHGTINVDETRLEQAVLVLVDNAAKYSQPDSSVSFNTSTWDDEFVLEVVDSGPGMDPEDLSRIFERFYRIDKVRSRRLGGAGLGLSIAKTIIDGHGGRIEVQSRIDEGTRMRIHIPLARENGVRLLGRERQRAMQPIAGTAGSN